MANIQLTLGRVAILVLGIAILGVGIHSHFASEWRSFKDNRGNRYDGAYRLCTRHRLVDLLGIKCPHIAMEKFFVSVNIIFFALTLSLLIVSFVFNMSSSLLKFVDLGVHLVGGIALFIGGVLYIVSAVQIENIRKNPITILPLPYNFHLLHLRYEEKLAAGALTLLQSLLYGALAIAIGRQ